MTSPARDAGSPGASRAVLPQFLGAALVWGLSFLFIKIGLEGLSPTQVVLGRLVAGALTLLVVRAALRQPFPRGRVVWGHLLVMSLLTCVAPFLLFAWAEQEIDSGLASIYNATVPLMTVLVGLVALRSERLTRPRLVGLGTGFLGVVVVLGPWQGLAGGSALAQGACLLATLCYGTSFIYLRRFLTPRGLRAVPIATAQVGLGALLLLLAAPFAATAPVDLSLRVVVSILVLGVFGTGLAYVWNTNVVIGWGPTNASTVTYLTPIVGVVAGILVLGERLTWNEPVGAAIVVLGIAVSQQRLRLPGQRAGAAAAPVPVR